MLSRSLLLGALLLLVTKYVFRIRFRELGRRLDRAVTVALVLILLAYGAHLTWWLISGR